MSEFKSGDVVTYYRGDGSNTKATVVSQSGSRKYVIAVVNRKSGAVSHITVDRGSINRQMDLFAA